MATLIVRPPPGAAWEVAALDPDLDRCAYFRVRGANVTDAHARANTTMPGALLAVSWPPTTRSQPLGEPGRGGACRCGGALVAAGGGAHVCSDCLRTWN